MKPIDRHVWWYALVMLSVVASPSWAVIEFADGTSHVVSDAAFGVGESIEVKNSTTVDFFLTGNMVSISVFDDSEVRVRAGTKVQEIHAATLSRVRIDSVEGTGSVPPANATVVESHLDSEITIFGGELSFLLTTERGHIDIHGGNFTSLGKLTVTEDSMMTIRGGTFAYGCAPCAWRIEDRGVIRLLANDIQVVDAEPLGFPPGSSRVMGTFANDTNVDVILEQGSIKAVALPALRPWAIGVLVASLLVASTRMAGYARR